jgi:hypothetical protein
MAATEDDEAQAYVEKIDCEQASLPGERQIRIKRNIVVPNSKSKKVFKIPTENKITLNSI